MQSDKELEVRGHTVVISTSERFEMSNVMDRLKYWHGIVVNVEHLVGASALVSLRMGVLRMYLDEFTSVLNRRRVISTLQLMNTMFERPVLVLESENPNSLASQSIFCRTKVRAIIRDDDDYVVRLWAELSQSKIWASAERSKKCITYS